MHRYVPPPFFLNVVRRERIMRLTMGICVEQVQKSELPRPPPWTCLFGKKKKVWMYPITKKGGRVPMFDHGKRGRDLRFGGHCATAASVAAQNEHAAQVDAAFRKSAILKLQRRLSPDKLVPFG